MREQIIGSWAATITLLVLLMMTGCSSRVEDNSRNVGSTATGGSGASMSGGIGDGAGVAGSGGSLGTGSTASTDSMTSATAQGCSSVGATRSCCGGGTQTCEGTSEFATWGPCLDGGGATLACNQCSTGEFGPGCDAGMDTTTVCAPGEFGPGCGETMDSSMPMEPPDAGSECGPGMACKPGSIRYCDDPAGEWTFSTCNSIGQWDPCVVTTVPAGAMGMGDCSPTDYSPEMCCPGLHLCCQNNPDGPFEDWGSGACAEIVCP